ncbi:MAG: hypothetical protein WCI67_09005 [Chloroflexales bacterium]
MSQTPQLYQLAPMFPGLMGEAFAREARVAFFAELLQEGPSEIILAACVWDIEAPPHLRGEARLQYLAGKVAEAEFPDVVPIAVSAA